jgi:hypothetical protein
MLARKTKQATPIADAEVHTDPLDELREFLAAVPKGAAVQLAETSF